MSIKRKTKSVNTILNIFKNRSEALSVVDLVDQLQHSMNKTTVYRILERLEEEGIVHSFKGTNGLKWYAKCKECSTHHHKDIHPHFECTNCGKVECLEIDVAIPEIRNRHIETTDVLLTGQCADCMLQ